MEERKRVAEANEKRARSFEEQSPQDVASQHALNDTPRGVQSTSDSRSSKKPREDNTVSSSQGTNPKTPDMASESVIPDSPLLAASGGAPMEHVRRSGSSESISSDLSAGSRGSSMQSPTPTPMFREVPPAPPSTPASHQSVLSLDGPLTPLPIRAPVLNADTLEEEMLLTEGAATPAPTQTEETITRRKALQEDFSEWAVGDRYKMIRMLGRGSYGEVAQALDLDAGRDDAFVAIKRIQSPFDQEVDAVRLYREIHILRRMRGHACIIQLLDIVQPPTDDLDDFHDLYLVFEYVETDLYKLIMSPQYLTTEHIQTFMYQMLIGVKFIHSCSVIHRDLKPANILLNEDCSLKICDFGLARIVDPETMSKGRVSATPKPKTTAANYGAIPKVGLTRQLTKHVVTRWYRAPELILLLPYSSAVDIWSLGCILAELLSMMKENVSVYENRKPLFPGGKCFPFSGEGDSIKKDDRLDQLSVIFNILGTPSDEDLKSVGKAFDYVKSLGKIQGKSFEELYPQADPLAIDLLKKMLLFNPARRITTDQAVEHEFFQGIRQPEMEKIADEPLEGPDFLDSNKIDLTLLKQRTFEEVKWFSKQSNKYGKPKRNSSASKPN